MRVFGRQISKWWLLLLVPVLVVGVPSLLLLLIVVGHFGGAIIGPPAIWDVPYHHPSPEALVGRYVESERHSLLPKDGPDAVLELQSDGTMTVSALPMDLDSTGTTCILSGSGKWSAPGGQQIDLDFTSGGAPGNCGSGEYSFLEVAGHSEPYKLYWVLGDPDSGTGIWLKRR